MFGWLVLSLGTSGPVGSRNRYLPQYPSAASSRAIQLLQRNSFDVSAPNFCKEDAFLWAARSGEADALNFLLDRGIATQPRDTAMLQAAAIGREEIVRILILKGVNVNVTGQYKRTPLHEAAAGGHENIVFLLLAYEADVNALSFGGTNPMFLAATHGRAEIVRTVLRW